MKLNTIFTVCAAISIAPALAAPSIVTARAGEGLPYPIAKMEWTGSVVPGGPNVTVIGTVQEVMDHLDKNFEEFNKEDRLAAAEKREIISSRTAYKGDCNIPAGLRPGLNNADFGHSPVQDAIRYFKGLGASSCGCGAHSCCRISCSYRTAVYLCNDNDYAIGPRCDWQGTNMVQWVDNNCRNYPHGGDIQGKVWDTENYSDTVQGADC